MRRVVIVGAGFGGLTLARELRDAAVEVLVVEQTNYHLFQPLLYQVATAGLEPADIAYPVRATLRRGKRTDVRVGEVVGADLAARCLTVAGGGTIDYDVLVLAAGARTATFGIRGVAEHAFGLKSLADAMTLRTHLLRQVEACAADPALLRAGRANVVVVGGGPTGVEMAGALSELYARVLAKDFPRLPLAHGRIVLVELGDALLAPFDRSLRRHAAAQLRRRGVELRLGMGVDRVEADRAVLADGSALPTRTVVWAAGVEAVPLAGALRLPQTAGGRIVVAGDLSVPGHPDVYVIGDLAGARDEGGALLPQLAPVAQQQARYLAARLAGGDRGGPFRYRDRGTMATIGRRAAVAEIPVPAAGASVLRLRGTLAWLAWLVLHLVMLIGFRNRASVLLNWAWNYLTWDRAARLLLDLRRGPAP